MPEGVRAGDRVFWRTAGTGPAPALMVHCALAHSGALKGLMAALGDLFTMTAFDIPGHGKSADWTGEGPLQDRVVAIARGFLDEAAGPVHLIGHSFGGTSLLRLAAEWPGQVATLTLIEPPFYDAARADGAPEVGIQTEREADFAAAQVRGEWEDAARFFIREWGAGRGWEDLSEDQRVYMTRRIHLIEGGGQGLNADRAGLLAPGGLDPVAMPVLLVRGDRSPVVIPAIERALAARLGDVRTLVVEGAGHMVPVTHPDEVAAGIRALVSP